MLLNERIKSISRTPQLLFYTARPLPSKVNQYDMVDVICGRYRCLFGRNYDCLPTLGYYNRSDA